MRPDRDPTRDSPAVGALRAALVAKPTTVLRPHFTVEELRDLAPTSDVARFALRLLVALSGIAHGGDRLKLQAIAQDAIREPS